MRDIYAKYAHEICMIYENNSFEHISTFSHFHIATYISNILFVCEIFADFNRFIIYRAHFYAIKIVAALHLVRPDFMAVSFFNYYFSYSLCEGALNGNDRRGNTLMSIAEAKVSTSVIYIYNFITGYKTRRVNQSIT